jgi:hypothetical protein
MFKGVVLETEIQLKFEVWKHLAERLDKRRGNIAHPGGVPQVAIGRSR